MKLNGLRKFAALVSAAAMTVSTFAAFAVPAGAAGDYEASTTVTQTAAEAVNATDDNIKTQSGDHNGEVRITPVAASETDYGAKIGIFKLGQVKAGSQVTVTAKLYTANNDLNGVGLYTTDSEVTTCGDYQTVMQGNALSQLGTIGDPSNAAKNINGVALSKSTFTGLDSVTAGGGKLTFDDSHLGTISYTADITSDNAGYLYFIAGGWNGTNRLMQIVDITAEYSSTLANTVEYASADGTVNVLKDVSIGSRFDIKKI